MTPRSDPFTDAYRDYAPRVLGYLRARGVEDPEAVTQEVFLALYGRIHDVRGGEGGVRSLLFTIAHARLVDYFRELSRRPAISVYEPGADQRTSASAEEHVLSSADEHAAVDLIAQLADEHREVIALRVIVGLSLSETAAVMGRSDGAVKQLQRRALDKLRARITVRNDHERPA